MDKTVSSRFSADLRLAERVHRQDRQGDLRIGSHSARCPRHIERIERETRIKKGDERLDYWNGSGARPAEIGLPWLA